MSAHFHSTMHKLEVPPYPLGECSGIALMAIFAASRNEYPQFLMRMVMLNWYGMRLNHLAADVQASYAKPQDERTYLDTQLVSLLPWVCGVIVYSGNHNARCSQTSEFLSAVGLTGSDVFTATKLLNDPQDQLVLAAVLLFPERNSISAMALVDIFRRVAGLDVAQMSILMSFVLGDGYGHDIAVLSRRSQGWSVVDHDTVTSIRPNHWEDSIKAIENSLWVWWVVLAVSDRCAYLRNLGT